MDAIVALGCRIGFRVYIKCIIRASLHARLTSNTPVAVEIYNSIVSGKQRFRWTDAYAWGVGAMITPSNGKYPSRIWKSSFLYLLYPGPIDADRHIMLGFASDCASVASDAFSVVNDKSKFHLSSIGVGWGCINFIS